MGMIETVEYTSETGNDIGKDVRIYGLTTCGFCRRAINYMKDNKLAFEYIYIDKIPLEDKKKLKEEKWNRRELAKMKLRTQWT